MRHKGVWYAIIAAFLIGVLIVMNKVVLNTSANPFVYVCATYLVASFLSLPFLFRKRSMLLLFPSSIFFKIGLLALLGTVAAPVIQIWGQRFTSAVNTSLLATLSSIFTVIFSAFLLKERVTMKNYVFVGPLFGGIYLLLVGFRAVTLNIGDILVLFSTVLFGFSNSFARTIMTDVNETVVAQLQMVVGALFLTLLLLFSGYTFLPQLVMNGGWYVLSGIITWLIVNLLYKGFKISGPVMTMFVILSYPVVATVGSLLVLNERLSATQVLGGVVILWSIYQIIKRWPRPSMQRVRKN